MRHHRLNPTKTTQVHRQPQTTTCTKSRANPLLQLQSVFGNRATHHMIVSQQPGSQSDASPQPPIQTKPMFRGLSQELTGDRQQPGEELLLTSNKGISPEMRSEQRVMRMIRDEGVEYDSERTEANFDELKKHGEGIKVPQRIIKFNFAGSGEEQWKTRKEKYRDYKKDKQKTIPEAEGDEKHQSGGLKYVSRAESPDRTRMVVEYAGPQGQIAGLFPGIRDSGGNETTKNLKDAKETLRKYVIKHTKTASGRSLLADSRPSVPRPDNTPHITVNIKGFSRGAATASVFAHWIKQEFIYKNLVDVNLVLIDPVQGTGFHKRGVGEGSMPKTQDVSSVYDAKASVATGATLVLPVRSGHGGKLYEPASGFNPQHVYGYQRIVIEYGEGVKHSWGMGESEKSTLKYQDKGAKESRKIKGMKFSTLPPGLFVVSSIDMQIKQVTSYAEWEEYKDKIEKSVPKDEPVRLKMIEEAVQEFLLETSKKDRWSQLINKLFSAMKIGNK